MRRLLETVQGDRFDPFPQTLMLLLKSLHLIFMVTWFAGLFYLPRLFVYHAMSDDQISIDRFKIMERKLYFGIMTPGAVLTLVFGVWLAVANGWHGYAIQTWFQLKLALLLLLVGYHLHCGKLLRDFKHDRNRHTHVWYRWHNEIRCCSWWPSSCLRSTNPCDS